MKTPSKSSKSYSLAVPEYPKINILYGLGIILVFFPKIPYKIENVSTSLEMKAESLNSNDIFAISSFYRHLSL